MVSSIKKQLLRLKHPELVEKCDALYTIHFDRFSRLVIRKKD